MLAWTRHFARMAWLVVALAPACCAPSTGGLPHQPSEVVRRYAPPGPPGDPWGPFIRPASAEFGVAEPLVYAVMWAESRGCQWLNGHPMRALSGEIGLMQIPPSIYIWISRRIGTGTDPYLPRDNIRAGVYSLSLMRDQFGWPDGLAAYQFGPTELRAAWGQGKAPPQATLEYQRRVWIDALHRTELRNQGRRWTGPDQVICTWPGH